MAAKPKQLKKEVKKIKPAKPEGVVVATISKTGARGEISLNKEIYGQKPNIALLTQSVRVILSNKRKANAKTKTRGEVSRSTAKIFKQKGTGNARHGSRSAPIFVGGGIAHGPHGIQNYQLKLPQKMRQKALISALSQRASSGDLFVASVEDIEPKTRILAGILAKSKLSKKITFVYENPLFTRVVRNLENVRPVVVSGLTAYDVLASKMTVLTQEAVEQIEKRLAKN
ncbi:MAG: 50S ribosomal protein L4 [bacterium]|nr:50S ribosomal protein L4 [bacterium]